MENPKNGQRIYVLMMQSHLMQFSHQFAGIEKSISYKLDVDSNL